MNRAAVPSVSHKLGSGRSHGTPPKDEQREEGRKQLFSVFPLTSSAAHTCFCTLSVVFSEAVISFCHALFFFFFGGLVFKRGNPVSAALDMDEIENLLFNSVIIIPVPLPFVFWSFLRT